MVSRSTFGLIKCRAHIEAIVAFRDTELGLLATSRGAMDNSRFGAVLVYTRRFQIR